MGLYDTIRYNGSRSKCANGHDLSSEDFQTKDLGCTLGYWSLTDENIEGEDGGYGELPALPVTGVVYFYTSCSECSEGSDWVEFEAELRDGKVLSISRVASESNNAGG